MNEDKQLEDQVEKTQKTCFVIMPISDVDGYEKGHFGRVYEYLIKPACEAAGYKVDRADDTSKTNMIIVDILRKAVKYDMAICDISSRNANVFYELGFRQAFNMKTVLIKDKKTSMPFDISSIRTLSYSETLRIDEVEKGRADIQKALEETEKTDPNDINSLISLLAISKAVIPKQKELSPEMNVLLNVINDLSKRIDNVSKGLLVKRDTDNIVVNDNDFIKYNTGDLISYTTKNGEEVMGKVYKDFDSFVLVSNTGKAKMVIPKKKIIDKY